MQKSIYSNNNQLINTLDLYVSKWKYILLFLILTLGCAYLYLRYATYEYSTTASIKIQEDKKTNPMSEISAFQSVGLFSSDFGKIEDEAQILKSRTLIDQVVKDLRLNMSFFVKGKIKDKEVYLNPPININFFERDSIIHQVDTTLYVQFVSDDKFTLSGYNTNELIELNSSQGISEHSFGDKISTGFGDIIITPNLGHYGPENGEFLKPILTPSNEVIKYSLQNINIQTTET